MGTRSNTRPGVRHKRTTFIVDRPFQLSVMFSVVALLNIAAIICFALIFLLPDASGLGLVPAPRVRALLIGTTVAYFVLAAGGVAVTAVIITHRVAGPARVLRQAVQDLRVGRLQPRVTLRTRDYLKDLATAIGELAQDLRDDAAHRRELVAALEAALDAKDLSRIRDLTHSIVQGPRVPAPAAPTPAPKVSVG